MPESHSLPSADSLDASELFAIVRADLACRWRRGERVLVEAYLERHPALRHDPVRLLELIYAEMVEREACGESICLEEYLRRFSMHEALRRQFAVHRTLQPGSLLDTSNNPSKPPVLSGGSATLPPSSPPPNGASLPPRQEDHTQVQPDADATQAVQHRIMGGGATPPGYEVLGKLGQGGMGVVYRARHLRLNRIVALKMVLHAEHAQQADLQRFLAEAEAVAQLQHRNVVQLFDSGQHNGLPFFTLELMPGGSLADRLREQPLPPHDAARMVEEIAQGVQHAHEKGIVHRDLKPANVLLASDGTPKVTDFGLARRVEGGSGLTAMGAVLGTPSYMAPEQAGGETKTVGPAADVYSLGAILYECLTGRPPFQGPTPVETLMQVIEDEPIPPSQLQPGVPRDLETICHKALQKEPQKRYGSAAALADDLGRFLAGEPIAARPIGTAERTWRWCRRRPAVAGLLALVAVSLLAGTVVSVAFAFRAESQRQAATQAQQEAEAARLRELDARQTAQRQLVDLCASSGLLAAKQNEHAQALLWFGRAAALAGDDNERGNLNRVRCTNWLHRMWRPARTFDFPNFHARDRFLVFDPHPGGRHLLVQTEAGAGAVWDLDRPLSRPLPGDHASAVAWSPDGARLAVVTAAGALEIYSFPALERVQTAGADAGARHLAFSPDGRFLAWAGTKGARVWDSKLAAFATPVLPHPKPVYALRFAPNGRLVTACDDSFARVYTVPAERAEPLFAPVPHGGIAHTRPSPEFVHDGRALLTITDDTVVWRDAATGKQLRSVPPPPGGLEVSVLVPHPDGHRVALVWAYGLRLWDAAAGAELGAAQTAQLIVDAAFDSTGEVLATAGFDCTTRLWSASANRPLEAVS